jgi:hypothetical protein
MENEYAERTRTPEMTQARSKRSSSTTIAIAKEIGLNEILRDPDFVRGPMISAAIKARA